MTEAREAPGYHGGRAGGNVRQQAVARDRSASLPIFCSRWVRGARAAAVIVSAVAVAACAPPTPDLVLLDARVFTADPARPWAEALAIRGSRITAVGSTAEIGALAGTRTVRRDLGGRTVLPGFNDAHVDAAGLSGVELRGFMQAALAAGITSMQWFAGTRPVREAGAALLEADAPVRVRVLRMPRPGPEGSTIDSRPHLPPQPGARVDIRGMAFELGEAEAGRLTQAVSWAYGTEDLLAIQPASDAVLERYVTAIEQTGPAEVWMRKRPRVEGAGAAAAALAPRLRTQGMVIVQRPDGVVPLRSLLRQGVHLALASGAGSRPFGVLAWATSPDRGAEALTMEEAVTAFTRGSAYAEFADRDKGHLSVGALADLMVCSIDPFSAPAGELDRARSVLTLVGGQSVHDVP